MVDNERPNLETWLYRGIRNHNSFTFSNVPLVRADS